MNKQTINIFKKIFGKHIDKVGIIEKIVYLNKSIFLGFLDLNPISETGMFHFSCPIRYFTLYQTGDDFTINFFDKKDIAEKSFKNMEDISLSKDEAICIRNALFI